VRRVVRKPFVRYVLAGGINTALTYALLLVAMRWLPYQLAYSIVYAAGIVLGYCLQSRLVFGIPLAWRAALRFPLVYVVQYLFGVVSLWLLVDRLHVDREGAALVVVLSNVPIGFAMSRLLLRARRAKTAGRP
jgi:putative flippase GtrA